MLDNKKTYCENISCLTCDDRNRCTLCDISRTLVNWTC